MKAILYVLNKVLLLWGVFMLYSCTKMDDYKKYFDKEEIIYIGKPDSLQIFAGRERVKLQWLIVSDPKVSSAMIYWANKTKERKINIKRGTSVDTVQTIIEDLSQGFHSFEVCTMDDEGNRSIPVYASGMVYGENYEQSLPNRSVEGAKFQIGGNTFVNWLLADSTSVGVRLSYKNLAGENKTLIVKNDETITELYGQDLGTEIKYQTMYKPDSLSIDTFYASIVTIRANEIILQNGGGPFLGTDISGRWGNLKDWDTNQAAKNHNGVGGFDNLDNNGYLSFEYWGTPSIINGKISQTLQLPKGKYRYVATVSNIDFECEATFLVISLGQQLPDVSDIEQALGYFQLTNNSLNGKDITVNFQLDTDQTITLGFLSTMLDNNPTAVRITKVRMYMDE
ncbi:DUF4998 domain-containing protein [Sphingobacterium corticibacterium]|nr:DUF4998 domain-containing protein [Sphingobacterium corticibacterium]